MRLVYLAGPYTHTDEAIMAERRQRYIEVVAHFVQAAPNLVLFSPIIHDAPVADHANLDHSFATWAQRNFFMIKKSSSIWVCLIDGWRTSFGLSQELEYAESINRDVLYVQKTPQKQYVLTDVILPDAIHWWD